MSNLLADPAEVKRGIALLHRPGDVVEVRILNTRRGVVSGYFDDHAAMAEAICEADAWYKPNAIYYTLNLVNPALLARACNRLKEGVNLTTADPHIIRRRWLPVDFDPVRPAGISSTDEEHNAAIERARIVRADMEHDWGLPILADSGNGAHCDYEIDLPNDQESLSFIIAALAQLDRRYSDNIVKVDLTSANAARIWKAYGTPVRKGDSIPGRPHRISRILEIP
jgi:hypothetical protein